MVFTMVVLCSFFGMVRRGSSAGQAYRQPHVSCVKAIKEKVK